MSTLADDRGLTTTLSEPNGAHPHWEQVMLDWHDMMTNPAQARMHIFNGAPKEVPYEEKLRRMQIWVEAIRAYDELMVSGVRKTMTKKEIEELIAKNQLPRIETVVLDTGTHGLRNLLTHFNFPISNQRPHPFLVPWSEFVEKAKTGEFLSAWNAQKGKS